MSGCLRVIFAQIDPGIARHVVGAMPKPIADLSQKALA
jgi:hypothetical protein